MFKTANATNMTFDNCTVDINTTAATSMSGLFYYNYVATQTTY